MKFTYEELKYIQAFRIAINTVPLEKQIVEFKEGVIHVPPPPVVESFKQLGLSNIDYYREDYRFFDDDCVALSKKIISGWRPEK